MLPSRVDLEALVGKPRSGLPPLRLNAVLRSDDTTLTHHAVRAAIGVACLPDCLIAADLAARRLLPVLVAGAERMTATLFVGYTSCQYPAPKMRSFIDFMSGVLRA